MKHLDVPEGEGSEGFLMFAQQGLLDPSGFALTNSDCLDYRVAQDQPLQGPSRQAYLYLELLQGHLWSATCWLDS